MKKETAAAPRRTRRSQPVLRFTPYAWAKLMYFRDRGGTEIGGFGICDGSDLLLLTDFVTVPQRVSVASVEFDDAGVADLFDQQIDLGRRPEQFARIWAHTHPGDSPVPSGTDEECFERCFGRCDWAVMFIVARVGKSYARIQFSTGPGGQTTIPVEVDYSAAFPAADHAAWAAEYHRHIHGLPALAGDLYPFDGLVDGESFCLPEDWLDELEAMGPIERKAILDELRGRPDLWQDDEPLAGADGGDEYERDSDGWPF